MHLTFFLLSFLLIIPYSMAVEKFYYHINDHLGNCRVIVNEQGEVEKAYDYYPFGKQLRVYQPGDAATFTFTGKQLDEEGDLDWYYFGERFYDPEIGRWVSVDPFAEKYPGLSPYVYTANNPLKYIDPDGRRIWVSRIAIQDIIQRLQRNPSRRTENYRRFLKYTEGKTLNELMHEADKGERWDSSAGGPALIKFVKDPRSGKTIDMRHFLVIGQAGVTGVEFVGLFVELQQWFRGVDSAFMSEDFFSNRMGALFFSYFYDPNSENTFTEQLNEFFNWLEEQNEDSDDERDQDDKMNEDDEEEE